MPWVEFRPHFSLTEVGDFILINIRPIIVEYPEERIKSMSAENVAEQIIESMGAQLDLLFTLAVAICGGIIVLIVQMALHENNKPVEFQGFGFLIVTFLLEGVSIIFGYLSRGSITSNIPKIYRIDFSKIDSWGSANFEGYGMLKSLFYLQSVTFFLGIVCLFILLCMNRSLIKGG